MPGVAGRKALVKVAGAAVAFVTEACTNSGDSKTYQITNAIKRVWDPTVAISVFYNAVLQAANTYTINRLTGKITFAVAQGASAVTVTGSYLPLSNAVRAKAFSWNVAATLVDDNDFDQVTTDVGFQRKQQMLLDVNGSVTAKFGADVYFRDALLNASLVLLEFFPDRTGTHDLVCWAVLNKSELQMALESTHEQTVEFQGDGDADNRSVSA
jgi:hypothetical protein